MIQLRGLETELVKKSRQNQPSKSKIVRSQQLKKRIKKLKWNPSNPQFDALVEGFSEHLVKEIKRFSVSQCVGCLRGTEVGTEDDGHAYCQNKSQCIGCFT